MLLFNYGYILFEVHLKLKIERYELTIWDHAFLIYITERVRLNSYLCGGFRSLRTTNPDIFRT